jgi:signal transduction histidine kinase
VKGGATSSRWFVRWVVAFGLASTGIGLATISGWIWAKPGLMALRASYIPMAPNTALGFVVLGAGLVVVPNRNRLVRRLAGAGALGVVLISALRLVEYAAGMSLAVDSWFMRSTGETFQGVPLGRMSLFTAIAFQAASVALVNLAWGRPANAAERHVAGAGGTIAGSIGLVFALGYLFSPNAPLLYGSASIPMALNTAIAFVTLGAGLVTAGGPATFPLQRLCGTSIRARLLRVFLPLVVGTVVVVAWLTHVVSTLVGPSSAAISSAALATAAIFVFGFSLERISGRVGEQIEQAETALQQAHDLLEVKVQERTSALSQANIELARAFRELHDAHESLRQTHEELKQTQGRMLEQARLASLGQTAAGVAHEINNPLAFVTNNMVVLKREVTDLHEILRLYQQAEETLDEYQHELLERIRELSEEVDLPFVLNNLDGLLERSRDGLKRIQKIVENLRDFARLDEAEFKDADLNAGISATVGILGGVAAKRGVTIDMELASLPKLACYPAKINMVVQNLVLNAIDACCPRGRVVVRTRDGSGAVEVEVADDGCGIEPAIQNRIFDPFFTTKPIGQGTGLGLSMTYGIIKDHGGTIDFESTPGRGSCFRFRIPDRSGTTTHASGTSDGPETEHLGTSA